MYFFIDLYEELLCALSFTNDPSGPMVLIMTIELFVKHLVTVFSGR